jgi:hypothetical protein
MQRRQILIYEMGLNEIKIVSKAWGKEFWMANTDLYCGK